MKKLLCLTIMLSIIITSLSSISFKINAAAASEQVSPDQIWTLTLSNPQTQSIKVLDKNKKTVSEVSVKKSGSRVTISPGAEGWENGKTYYIYLYVKDVKGSKTSIKLLKEFEAYETDYGVTFNDEETTATPKPTSLPDKNFYKAQAKYYKTLADQMDSKIDSQTETVKMAQKAVDVNPSSATALMLLNSANLLLDTYNKLKDKYLQLEKDMEAKSK